MRAISWIFTIAGLVLIVACFFNDEIILLAIPVTLLAAWTDDWANDIELRDFLESSRRNRS